MDEFVVMMDRCLTQNDGCEYTTDMTLNRIITASLIASSAIVGIGIAPVAIASADTITVTVDGHDYPVCAEEDCSDQPGQIGVWTNREGHSFLELGEDVTVAIQP